MTVTKTLEVSETGKGDAKHTAKQMLQMDTGITVHEFEDVRVKEK